MSSGPKIIPGYSGPKFVQWVWNLPGTKNVPRVQIFPGTKIVQWERKCTGTELFPQGCLQGWLQINLGENPINLVLFPKIFPAWTPESWKFTGNVTVVGITSPGKSLHNIIIEPKKFFSPGTVEITSVQQSWKIFFKKVVYFSLSCAILLLTTTKTGPKKKFKKNFKKVV